MAYALLFLAILLEVTASLALKASVGLTRLWPSLLALAGFGLSLALLAQVSARLPISLTYPAWAGLGIAGTTLGGVLLFGEVLSVQHCAGLAVLVLGICILFAPDLMGGAAR